jgi:hypothetical protein
MSYKPSQLKLEDNTNSITIKTNNSNSKAEIATNGTALEIKSNTVSFKNTLDTTVLTLPTTAPSDPLKSYLLSVNSSGTGSYLQIPDNWANDSALQTKVDNIITALNNAFPNLNL